MFFLFPFILLLFQNFTSDGFSFYLVYSNGKFYLRCCFHWSSGTFFCVFALFLAKCGQTSLGSAIEDSFAILIHLELNNKKVRWMNSDIHIRSIGFFALYSLDVYNKLSSVHLYNLANLISLVVTTNNLK